MVSFNVFADSIILVISSLSNGSWIVLLTPSLPRMTGKLKQQLKSGWRWLMGYTSCLSNRIEVQILATMEEIPNGLAPLPRTICCEI